MSWAVELTQDPCESDAVAKLTVVIDDDVLKRARRRALDQGTSVDAVVRGHLEAYAGGDHVAEALSRLVELADDFSSGSGGRTWTRDELYER